MDQQQRFQLVHVRDENRIGFQDLGGLFTLLFHQVHARNYSGIHNRVCARLLQVAKLQVLDDTYQLERQLDTKVIFHLEG